MLRETRAPHPRPLAASVAATLVLAPAVATLALAPAVAIAQSTPEVADASVRPLGTITVTAKASDDFQAKDSQVGVLGDLPLLSTPFSVNVITHDLLVDQQAAYLGDFLKNDPSASVGNVVISFATLRGFSLGSSGFLLDGLGVGSLLLDGRVGLDAYDRIDILKGASMFLYGTSGVASLGGAINYIPKRPLETPVRDVAVVYASRAQFGVEADLGDRFGPDRQFGYRLNAAFRDGDTAVDDSSWQQGSLALAVDWRVNRDVLLQGSLGYVDNTFDGIQPFFIGASDAQGNPVPIPAAPDVKHAIGPSWNTFDQRVLIGTLRADWSITTDWSLTAQYAGGRNERPYDGTKDTRFGSITSAGGDILLFASEETSRVKVDAGQVLLHGKAVTGAVRHGLTFGASASQEKHYDSFTIAGFVPGSLYQSNEVPEPANVPIDLFPYTGKTTSYGLFASDVMDFGEHWSVLVGGRQARVTAYDASGNQPPGASVSRFSPAAALMFKPSGESLLYVNYAEGLEPGGTAPDDTVNAGDVMGALVTRQYELGGRIDLGGVTLSGALFDMRRPLQFRDASNAWVASGDQVHRGLEVQASGGLTRDLRIVAGAMYLDGRQRGTGNDATDGKRVPGVPEWTANLYVDYAIAAVPGLFINAGVYYSAAQYFDVANLQPIPAWTRFDVGARYETRVAGHDATFLLAVENVGDRNYWASALGSALTLADPLTVKATARVRF